MGWPGPRAPTRQALLFKLRSPGRCDRGAGADISTAVRHIADRLAPLSAILGPEWRTTAASPLFLALSPIRDHVGDGSSAASSKAASSPSAPAMWNRHQPKL